MLSHLKIKNLVIVEELEITFNSSLNIITGETGAGKSIILKAISLLGGTRSTSDIIRNGQEKLEIEGFFNITADNRTSILDIADELIEIIPDEDIIIRRIIETSGKSRAYLNSSLIPLATLQKISQFLFDITGQHQQQALIDSAKHIQLLDNYGGFTKELAEIKESFHKYSSTKKLLDDFKKSSSEKSEYFRRIAFEQEELKSAELEFDERKKLESDLNKLQNGEFVSNTVNECLNLLNSEDISTINSIAKLRQLTDTLRKKDKILDDTYLLVDSVYSQIKEIDFTLNKYLADLEVAPERLEEIRSRITEIARLERKYHLGANDIIAYLEKINKELNKFEAGEFDITKLENNLRIATSELENLAKEISLKRKNKALLLEQKVEKELARLEMKKAKFKIEITPNELSATGGDDVEFLLSANPGESPKPLGKVASGGELSRVLLTLKTILNEKYATIMHVFDEVDTGVSGIVASVVGEKVKAISEKTQVLLITHSPQIAALADAHFVISKSHIHNNTIVKVKHLNQTERVEEVARMLGGKNVNDKFIELAKEMIIN